MFGAAAVGIAGREVERHRRIEAMREARADRRGVAVETAAERERGLAGRQRDAWGGDRGRRRDAAARAMVKSVDLVLQPGDLRVETRRHAVELAHGNAW